MTSSPAPRASALAYMPQLDALRGIGVLIIMVYHFGRSTPAFQNIELGHAAMGMFFTLSGYLITGILLRSREKIDSGQWSFGHAYGHYFIRRALRIFPIYYAILLLALATNAGRMQRDILWHATYTSNIMFVWRDALTPAIHLWSLSVEEQFYLLWPFFVLLTPRRLLPWMMFAVCCVGVWYRAAYFDSPRAILYMTPAQLDYLALGGLLAFVDTNAPRSTALASIRRALPLLSLAIGVLLLAVWYFAADLGLSRDQAYFTRRTSFCFTGIFFVAGAATGFTGPLGFILTWRPLIYLGTVSYACYVVHIFIAQWYAMTAARLGYDRLPRAEIAIPLFSVLSILFASLSWRYFEAPILALKDRLAPVKPSPAPPSP